MGTEAVTSYVLATTRRWHEGLAQRLETRVGAPFHLVTSREELTAERLTELAPRYVFLPHWSHIVPPSVFEAFECVIFHMTDVPFGRGGSPLQNLIARGHTETKLTALRCVAELDAGPVYAKRPLSLHGCAEEIYLRAGRLVEELIAEIAAAEPDPQPQRGEPVVFPRRKPAESDLAVQRDLDGRPSTTSGCSTRTDTPGRFLDVGPLRLTFSRAARRDGRVVADVEITQR